MKRIIKTLSLVIVVALLIQGTYTSLALTSNEVSLDKDDVIENGEIISLEEKDRLNNTMISYKQEKVLKENNLSL